MVARPVGRKEISQNPKAQEAVLKEWDALREKGVWVESDVRERKDVINWAKKEGIDVQFGRIHCICVEKNHELPEDHPNR